MSRTTEPTEITQGERIEWTRSFCDFSSEDYTLQYRYRGPGTGIDVDATADGTGFNAVLTASVTAPTIFNIAGKYNWQAWLTEIADSTNKFIVDQGTITVRQGFISGETGDIDLRSDAKIMLDTLDAALLASAGSDTIEYEISTPSGSRRVKRTSREDALKARAYYAGIVARENNAERVRNGGPFAKPVKVRMFEQ